jgi:hypothetical protein
MALMTAAPAAADAELAGALAAERTAMRIGLVQKHDLRRADTGMTARRPFSRGRDGSPIIDNGFDVMI